MFFELAFGLALAIILLAFFAEYIDSTLGMGYGTTLTPILLLMGFEPLQIVPAVLLSELVTGLLAGFTHHQVGNVDLKPRTMNVRRIYWALRCLGVFESFRRGVPFHLKITLLIAGSSILGTLVAVAVALSLSTFYLKLYIGVLVVAIGLAILLTLGREYPFSWKKIIGLSVVASFNKGISGGGYGPVITGGQLLSGIGGQSAVGITSLAEGLTCLVGFLAYLAAPRALDLVLAPYLVFGAVLSVPLSALTVKVLGNFRMRLAIGILTAALGGLTLVQTLL